MSPRRIVIDAQDCVVIPFPASRCRKPERNAVIRIEDPKPFDQWMAHFTTLALGFAICVWAAFRLV